MIEIELSNLTYTNVFVFLSKVYHEYINILYIINHTWNKGLK